MVKHSCIVIFATLTSGHSAPVAPTQHSARPLITRSVKWEAGLLGLTVNLIWVFLSKPATES
jgi:hypothetical protein